MNRSEREKIGQMKSEFVESNPCVKKWLVEKARRSKGTASLYEHNIYHYCMWLKENTEFKDMQSLLDDFKAKKREGEEYEHIDLAKAFVLNDSMKLKSKSYRQNSLSAIRSFYEYNRCALPKEKVDLTVKEVDVQRVREKLGLKPMTLKDLEQLIAPMKIKEKAMLTIIVQSGMGVGEFTKQFNVCTCRKEWLRNNGHVCEPAKVMRQLKEEVHPIKIDIVGRKKNPRPYFTFIGTDGIELLKRYLVFRAILINKARKRLQELEEKVRKGHKLSSADQKTLVNYRRKLGVLTPEWSPGQPIFISNQISAYSIQSLQSMVKLYKRVSGLSDREFTPHTCRDIFKTECAHAGVKNTLSEFFIGHTLDKYGYNKLNEMYPEDFVKEYLKVEPALNIITHTGRPKVSIDEMERLKKENLVLSEKVERLEVIVGRLTEVMSPEQVKGLFEERKSKHGLRLPERR